MTMPPRRRRTDEPLQALVVDDDGTYRDYLAGLTRRIGFAAEEASDGDAALASFARAPADLILVDHELPRMSGLDLISRLRSDDTARNVYAVMLTGKDDGEARLSALAAGFDDLLPKSSPEVELVAKIDAARRIVQRQRVLAEKMHEMYGLAMHDDLTGTFNRRFLIDEIERLMKARAGVGIALFDLDDFKIVNDTFGHLAGDRVLRDLGALFHGTTRPEDLVARYGGDEFVLIAEGVGPSELARLAERLASEIRSLRWSAGETTFGIGVTTGLALSRDLTAPTDLLEAADRDLYRNKRDRKHDGSSSPHTPRAGSIELVTDPPGERKG